MWQIREDRLMQLRADDVRTLSELLRRDGVKSRGQRAVWSSSDRAVRRKVLVRSGQDVSVYGFSMNCRVEMVGEGTDRCGIGKRKACRSQAYNVNR